MYVIWSVSMHGWLTPTATYSSELDDAKRLGRDEAIKACQVHFDKRLKGFEWIPVYLNDLKAIRERK